MTRPRKIVYSLLTVVGIVALLLLGLSRDDEAYWRAQAAKVHEGMTRAEVEKILPDYDTSTIQKVRRYVDSRILHRVHIDDPEFIWLLERNERFRVSPECFVKLVYSSQGVPGVYAPKPTDVVNRIELERIEKSL